jgi:hypothetical protein
MTADTELLGDVGDIVEGRSEKHGSPENSFSDIARYWNAYLESEDKLFERIEAGDVAEMMALLKLARSQSGEYNEDDYRDRLGYVLFANKFNNE